MSKYLLAFTLFVFTVSASAEYNANHSSVIDNVAVYAEGDYIYIKLKDKPTTACDNGWFVISETVPENRRQMMLSRLLLAYASKEEINIGYDSQEGNCVNSYVRVHRVG